MPRALQVWLGLPWRDRLRWTWRKAREAVTGSTRIRTADRAMLEDVLLPALAADPAVRRLLFVGCETYTRTYAALFGPAPGRFRTIDIDPAQAAHGTPDHIVAPIQAVASHVPPASLDAVVLNGVYGWGVDERPALAEALAAVATVLRPGGLLLLGWNDVAVLGPFDPEPVAIEAGFARDPANPLGAWRTATDTPTRHTFDVYVRAGAAPGGDGRGSLDSVPMSNPSEPALLAALQAVVDPETGRDLVSTKQLRNLRIDGGDVAFEVEVGYPSASTAEALRRALVAAARSVPGVENASVAIRQNIVAHAVQRGVPLIGGVKNIVAVASGKGGVGKSTTAANLALALAAEGATVGLLDADIYGPSIPTMMGAEGRPQSSDEQSMEPLVAHGVQLMSIGFLVQPGQAMVWRGPMASQALEQLLKQTRWKDLDYLVVDMPPGTGDIQLSLAQKAPVTGAVIVTTPQDIALIDARKAIDMFQKVNVPILGVVENMAVHVCERCGHVEHVFGAGGGARIAAESGVEVLGSLPLRLSIREQADSGTPTVAADPDGEAASLYRGVARRIAAQIARQSKDYSSRFPTIAVSANT